jgi:hypothetical protein
MPFPPAILDDLARAGVNIVVDTLTAAPGELPAVVRLWDQSAGNVTIRNAGRLSDADLMAIARTLGGRVTLEE